MGRGSITLAPFARSEAGLIDATGRAAAAWLGDIALAVLQRSRIVRTASRDLHTQRRAHLAIFMGGAMEKAKRDYVPVVFDFENSPNRTTVETAGILAHMARFVIADLTDAYSGESDQ
ncbi:MAG: hypothetical protein AB7G75_31645 [Candidatus Binatia bacterium]